MFERHRAAKAAEAHQAAVAAWTQQRDGYAHMLELATTFPGAATNEILLGAREGLFYTAVDTGTVFTTNKRVIFTGAKATRECAFAKLIGFHHDDAGFTTFSVSNRQKPTTVHYGPALSADFDFRLDSALAHFKGTLDDLVAQPSADVAQIESERPVASAGVAG